MTKLPQTQGVVDFIKKYLYNSTNYKFDDGTTQAINVPYPDSGVYENYILHYPDATSTEILDINIDQLYSEVMVLTDAKIERAYEYILEERDPGNSTTNVLITVGVDDEAVFDGSATSYLHQLQNDYGFRSIVVSIGSQANYLVSLSPTTGQTYPVGPCQCTGRWVYNGDLAIAFEFLSGSDGSQNVTNFVRNTLLSNPDSYGLSYDVNGNQPSKLTIVPYPDSNTYPIYPYGSIHNPSDIGSFIDADSGIQTIRNNPSISDALDVIDTLKVDTGVAKVALIVGSNGSDVTASTASATKLKNDGYTVITVTQTASADVFRSLASGNQYALHIGDGNDNDVATQIANLLLDLSFVCFDDGSSTPSPITRCPGSPGTTQPGVIVSTPVGPSCAAPYTGRIVTVFELNAVQPEIQDVVTFVSSNLYNSANYDFSGITQAINIPYGNTDNYDQYIQDFGDSESLTDLQNNINTLYMIANMATNPTVSDGLAWLRINREPPAAGSNAVIIVVGYHADDNFGLTSNYINILHSQGYKFISVAVGAGHGNLSPIADNSKWYFQVGDSNGQSVADQISSILFSTPVGPSCAAPYTGRIVTVFELNAVQPEIQDVVTFVSSNLYNSANYDFSGITQAINVPYPDTDLSAQYIQNFGDSKSLADLQSNIDTLLSNAVLSTNPTVSDGLAWLRINREPPAAGSNAVIIVVGYHADDNFGLTSNYINILHSQGYKFISVAVGAGHGNLSPIADKPKSYFQVGDSNGQSVADQISSILCNWNPSTSTVPLTSSSSPGTSTAMPTIAPGQCYYQSNVAVAFETSSTANDTDLQIQNFITNNLFFYSGAPYILGNKTDTKTELSLVPYPNEDSLAPYMAYGEASTASDINTLMGLFQQLAQGRSSIADAFNIIPKNSRTGPPGFVILVANSADSVQNAIASATSLKNLGFKIITVAYKSSGSFKDLSSDPSYNFQIHQDADQSAVAMAIGNILNATYCLQS